MKPISKYMQKENHMKAWTNRAELIGAFEGEPEYNHTAHDRNFYKARLMCVRHSGKADYIPVIIPESRVDFKHTYKDDFCAITGQVRTYNNRKTNRLEMTVYADDISIIRYNTNENNVELDGYICKKPFFRVTRSGMEITDFVLAVSTEYIAAYIPCICWSGTAKRVAELPVGTRLKLHGRFQSREYLKFCEGIAETRVAYEVSASIVEVVDETGNCGEKADGSGDPGADDGAGHAGGRGDDAGGSAMEECEMGRGTL